MITLYISLENEKTNHFGFVDAVSFDAVFPQRTCSKKGQGDGEEISGYRNDERWERPEEISDTEINQA